MSDQAQGLRALADQARRDQSGYSHHPMSVPIEPSEASGVRAETGVVAPPHTPPPIAVGIALADARLYPPETAPRLLTCLPEHAVAETPPTRHRARVVAVTSGKGGVGKTNFSGNLALLLARSGQRVLVLDADLGLANLHVVLGVAPQRSLEHVMRGEKTLRQVICPGPGGVQIIGGGSGIVELANLDEPMRLTFLQGLKELDTLADVILIDTGAGLSRNVMAFLCAVEEIIVVTTPEPTAITDAYATIKVVSQENPAAHIMLVVNMVHSEAEGGSVANKLNMIARQFLRLELDYLGCIPQDAAVSRAVRHQQPFVLHQPTSAAAHSIVRIAAQLGYSRGGAVLLGGMNGFLNRMQRFFGFRTDASTSESE